MPPKRKLASSKQKPSASTSEHKHEEQINPFMNVPQATSVVQNEDGAWINVEQNNSQNQQSHHPALVRNDSDFQKQMTGKCQSVHTQIFDSQKNKQIDMIQARIVFVEENGNLEDKGSTFVENSSEKLIDFLRERIFCRQLNSDPRIAHLDSSFYQNRLDPTKKDHFWACFGYPSDVHFADNPFDFSLLKENWTATKLYNSIRDRFWASDQHEKQHSQAPYPLRGPIVFVFTCSCQNSRMDMWKQMNDFGYISAVQPNDELLHFCWREGLVSMQFFSEFVFSNPLFDDDEDVFSTFNRKFCDAIAFEQWYIRKFGQDSYKNNLYHGKTPSNRHNIPRMLLLKRDEMENNQSVLMTGRDEQLGLQTTDDD